MSVRIDALVSQTHVAHMRMRIDAAHEAEEITAHGAAETGCLGSLTTSNSSL